MNINKFQTVEMWMWAPEKDMSTSSNSLNSKVIPLCSFSANIEFSEVLKRQTKYIVCKMLLTVRIRSLNFFYYLTLVLRRGWLQPPWVCVWGVCVWGGVCVCVCVFVCLFLFLFVCLFVCLFVYFCFCFSLQPKVGKRLCYLY